jgi:hypothetical protein
LADAAIHCSQLLLLLLPQGFSVCLLSQGLSVWVAMDVLTHRKHI